MREGDLWCMDLIEECIKMSRRKNVYSESVQELGTDTIRKKYATKVLKKSVFQCFFDLIAC